MLDGGTWGPLSQVFLLWSCAQQPFSTTQPSAARPKVNTSVRIVDGRIRGVLGVRSFSFAHNDHFQHLSLQPRSLKMRSYGVSLEVATTGFRRNFLEFRVELSQLWFIPLFARPFLRNWSGRVGLYAKVASLTKGQCTSAGIAQGQGCSERRDEAKLRFSLATNVVNFPPSLSSIVRKPGRSGALERWDVFVKHKLFFSGWRWVGDSVWIGLFAQWHSREWHHGKWVDLGFLLSKCISQKACCRMDHLLAAVLLWLSVFSTFWVGWQL